jgi:hypothetical protein
MPRSARVPRRLAPTDGRVTPISSRRRARQSSTAELAACACGCDRREIAARLGGTLTGFIAAATLALATAIIDVADLGFLGLGPPDSRTPEWETMLTDATKYLRQAPWLISVQGESLDPRLER